MVYLNLAQKKRNSFSVIFRHEVRNLILEDVSNMFSSHPGSLNAFMSGMGSFYLWLSSFGQMIKLF